MKILVTGASGFVGQHVIQNLVQRFEHRADVKIIATTRGLSKVDHLNYHGRVHFIDFDLSISDKTIFDRLGKPDLLIHLAWHGLPNYMEPFHVEKNLPENILFLKHLIDSGLQNITITGTCLEYGMVEGCLVENMVTNPVNPYAIAKDTLRKYIEVLSSRNKFSWKWLRLFYTYGPGQSPQSLTSQIERSVADGDSKFNMSGGEQLRDYLTIQAVADNIVKCALQSQVDGVINCCSGSPISVRKFVEDYLFQRGYDIRLNLGFYPYPVYEPMAFWGDSNKLKTVI